MASKFIGKAPISERKHIEREMHEYFSLDDAVLFSDEDNSSVYFPDGLKVGSKLEDISEVAGVLNNLLGEINAEFANPSKRVHGRHYTHCGRMYRWDSQEQELIRVQTHEEKEFAKEYFAIPAVKKEERRDYRKCRFKRHYSRDSSWSLCAFEGKCTNKKRLTSVYCGGFGRDWFCGPTCQ